MGIWIHAKAGGESGGLNDLFALIKDKPGFPVLGFDPLNQLDEDRLLSRLILNNTPDYADIKYFINNKPITVGYSIVGADKEGTYTFVLALTNKIQDPTAETIVSDPITVTIAAGDTSGQFFITPFRNGQTGIDSVGSNVYAALKVIKVSGDEGDVDLTIKSVVQGQITTFRDTVTEMILFKLLHNPTNLWERIIDADSLSDVQKASRITTEFGAKQYLQFIILTEREKNIAYFIVSIEFDFYYNTVKVDKIFNGDIGQGYVNYNKAGPLFNTLMDIHYGYSRDTLFFNSGSLDPDELKL